MKKRKLLNTFSFLLIGLFSMNLASCEEHVHAFTEQVIVKAPTCTEEGVGYYVCPEDGTRTQDLSIPALGHVEAVKTIPPTCTEQGYDVHYCTRCGLELGRDNYVEPKGHTYHTTVVPPTCTEDGYTIYECECGDDCYAGDYTEPLGHDYVDTVVPPTCTEEGYTIHECSRCGDRYIDSKVPALDHDLIHHEGHEPTCTEDGWEEYDTCSRCDYSTYTPIPAHGHHYRKTIVAPTCTEPGHTHYECLICGDEHDGDYVEALDHDYVEYPEKPATCDEAGHKAHHVCSRCGDSNYEEIPPLGTEHDYMETVIPPTQTSRGYTLHTCTHCGATYKSDFVAPLPISSVIDADEAVSKGLITSDKLVLSSRDDDYYYYAVYLGHVSNFIFHSLYDFVWTENMGKLGTYPKQRDPAKPMDVLENYQTYQSIWGDSIPETLLSAISLEAEKKFTVISATDDKPAKAANQLFIDAGLSGLLESTDPSLAGVAGDINALPTPYIPGEGMDEYEESVQYTYAAVADLDLYVAVAYDIANETFAYQPCSRLASPVKESFAASTTGTFGNIERTLGVAASASRAMGVPTAYTTNHPLISYPQNDQHIYVNMTGGDTAWNTLGNADEYLAQGYDSIYIHLDFYLNCGGIFGSSGATFRVAVINHENGIIWNQDYSVTKNSPRWESKNIRTDFSLFTGGIVGLYSDHISGFAYDIRFVSNFYLYNSTAYDLGAYKGTAIDP